MRFFSLIVLAAATPAFAGPVNYVKQVKPLLAARCSSCHGALAQKAKLRLDTAAFIRKGGRSGPAIKPGKSGASLLIEAVRGQDRIRMPPENEGAPLSTEQIDLLKGWIDQGAAAPADEPIPEDPKKHWAFQKLVRPAVPVRQTASSNPIDAFVSTKLEQLKLKMSPPADRASQLRRVYLDLVGLPPTRDELHAFLADPSTDAYAKAVDRLLSSPRHGERWARHWMDVWRYSDWYGRRMEKDWRNSSPTIWRWRDWIVRSLNEDKGYDRMVQEMLAADEFAPEDDAVQAATGFLVRNYFSYNHDTWMKDQVEHTAKAFLGLTLNCCHCHDHKYDPITQEEYFRFRAFFEPIGLRQDRVAGEPDPGPFQRQDYSNIRKVISSGLVRVLDERLDATTRMYRLGNERDYLPNRPAVTPAAPAIVGGDRIRIEPISLPALAHYPGLKQFIRDQEIVEADKELAAARSASPVDLMKIAVAEARQAAVQAVIAADRAKYDNGPGELAALTKAASKAQTHLALCRAKVQLAQAEQTLATAKAATKPDAAGQKKAAQAVETAKNQLAAAQKADDSPPATYTPLTPIYPTQSTGRRRALARWITARDNPLTARVAVNHLWMRHFGTPLVESVFDLGRNGKRPSHPELLDWLAVELMDSGWQMKHLHRLIVLSNTYRQSSRIAASAEASALDADNRWLWHYPSRRLEAEVVRDAMLAAAGDLDPAMGGRELEPDQEATSRRRSLYFTCHPEGNGSLRLLEFFDAPDPCDCYRRSDSLVPQQALALTNSAFAVERSRTLARRLLGDTALIDDDGRIVAAFEQTLTRPPTAAEGTACRDFLKAQRELVGNSAGAGAADARAWESLVRVLFNHHEFVTMR